MIKPKRQQINPDQDRKATQKNLNLHSVLKLI